MKLSEMVTELGSVQYGFEKINQRGITWKLRKGGGGGGGQSFLCATHCSDLIHIPIKLQEDVPNGY